jgi:hypothetical protein
MFWLVLTAAASTLHLSGPAERYDFGDDVFAGVVSLPSGERVLVRSGDDYFAVEERGVRTPLMTLESHDFAAFGDLDGDGWDEAFFLHGGDVVAVDLRLGYEVLRFPGAAPMYADDLDGDGTVELLGMLCGARFCVRDSDSRILWRVSSLQEDGRTLEADGDPTTREVIVDGVVYDGWTGTATPLLGTPVDARPLATGDFDGDGIDEVVTEDGTVFDVHTGQPRTQLGRLESATFVDLDDDGVLYLWDGARGIARASPSGDRIPMPRMRDCSFGHVATLSGTPTIVCENTLTAYDRDGFHPLARIRRLSRIRAADVDGDGEPELVGLGAQVAVFEPGSFQLDYDRDDVDTAVLRWPGGRNQVVDTREGLTALRLTPSGFVEDATVFDSHVDLPRPHLVDANADGVDEVVFTYNGTWWVLDDPRAGAVTDTGIGADAWTPAQLDGLPGLEFVGTGGILGTTPLSLENTSVVRAPQGGLLLGRRLDRAELYDLRLSSRPVASSTPANMGAYGTLGLWFASERLWYANSQRVRSLPPTGGDEWHIGTGSLVDAPVVIGNDVWLLTPSRLERWTLP